MCVFIQTEIKYLLKCYFKLLPIKKDELYARCIMIAHVSPMEGVYIISTVPTMAAPPTHVATGWMKTQQIHLEDKEQLFVRRKGDNSSILGESTDFYV